MGLVMSRGVGEALWIGDDRFHVAKIAKGVGCTLMDRYGKEIAVGPASAVSLGDEISIQEGIRRTGNATKLVIRAPRAIPILRGDQRETAAPLDDSQSEVALLAPVPREHLVSGLKTCQDIGKVAFGSRAWETFNDLEKQLDGSSCPVLIYGSIDKAPFPPKATWRATYLGFVEARDGRHPNEAYRPQSTETDRNTSYIFWEVEHLTPINADHAIEVGSLYALRGKKRYDRGSRPERPTLIENPFIE
ncbi:MAG: hypothetical protein WDN31_00780 [Hyphomicrobium sp.]